MVRHLKHRNIYRQYTSTYHRRSSLINKSGNTGTHATVLVVLFVSSMDLCRHWYRRSKSMSLVNRSKSPTRNLHLRNVNYLLRSVLWHICVWVLLSFVFKRVCTMWFYLCSIEIYFSNQQCFFFTPSKQQQECASVVLEDAAVSSDKTLKTCFISLRMALAATPSGRYSKHCFI